MLWPFCPTPELSETLSFVTDVIQPVASEQRIRFLDAPRQSFAYSHAMTFRQYERAKLMVESNGYSDWDVPVLIVRELF
jgi:hypothetical protein